MLTYYLQLVIHSNCKVQWGVNQRRHDRLSLAECSCQCQTGSTLGATSSTWPEVDRSRPRRQSKREVWRHFRWVYCRFDHHLTTTCSGQWSLATRTPSARHRRVALFTQSDLWRRARRRLSRASSAELDVLWCFACSLCWCQTATYIRP